MEKQELIFLLHPTIAEIYESGDEERAVSLAKRALEAAENDREIGPFRRAEECNSSWYQLAILYTLLDKEQEAAEAAKKTFEYDQYIFNQHLNLVHMLLKVGTSEMDKVVSDIAWWFNAALFEFHGEEEIRDKIRELLREYADRSADIRWELADQIYFDILQQTDDDPELYNDLFEMIEDWRAEGRSNEQCDAAKCNLLYFMDREDEILDVWGDRPLDKVPFLAAFQRICRQMIVNGIELPDPLPFPDVTDLYQWLNSTKDIYLDYYELVRENGLTPEVEESLTEEERDILYKRIKFHRAFAQKGLSLYDDFFDGAINGSATAPYQYVRYLDTYGEILGHTGDRQLGMETLEKGMEILPHQTLARSIVSLALDMKDGKKTLKALHWLDENESENYDWEMRHMHDRLEVWGKGLISTLPEYLEVLNDYKEKYKELHRVFKFAHIQTLSSTPQQYQTEKHEFVYGLNNTYEVLKVLREEHPDNIDLLLMMLKNRMVAPSLESCEEMKVLFENFYDKLSKDNSDDGKYRFCEFLCAYAYCFIRSACTEDENEELVVNNELVDQALKTLETADAVSSSKDQKIEITILKSICYELKRDYESVIPLTNKGLELLEDVKPDCVSPNIRPYSWRVWNQPLEECPPIVLNFFHYQRLRTAEKLELNDDKKIEAHRGAYLVTAVDCMTWYNLGKLLLPKALENVGSEDYKDCYDFTERYLRLFQDEPEDPERGELLYVMAQLALSQKRVRYAKEILELDLKVNYSNDEDVVKLTDKIAVIEKELKKDTAAYEETVNRRKKTVKRYRKECNVKIPSNIYLTESSAVTRRRSAEEIARVAIAATLIGTIASDVLDENFDENVLEKRIRQLKELDAYDSLSSDMLRFIDRCSNEPQMMVLTSRLQAVPALYWVLGLNDSNQIPNDLTSSSDLIQKFSNYNTLDDFIADTNLRSIDEILDQLDYAYCGCWTAVYSDKFDRNTHVHPSNLQQWYHALSWVVDADGCNNWDNVNLPY